MTWDELIDKVVEATLTQSIARKVANDTEEEVDSLLKNDPVIKAHIRDLLVKSLEKALNKLNEE